MTPEKLSKWMKANLDYGMVDADGNVLTPEQERLTSTDNPYALQSPSMLKQTKVGTCWDQVEFQRHFFKKMLNEGVVDVVHHFYLMQNIEPMLPTHTFTVYEQDG
jgi:hypothetical protein